MGSRHQGAGRPLGSVYLDGPEGVRTAVTVMQILDRHDNLSSLCRGGRAANHMSDIVAIRPIAPAGAPPEFSKRAVVAAVARRGGPKLLEATVIPAVLFYSCLVWGSLDLAYITAVVWMYGCVLRRVAMRQAIPGILILGAVGISVRTVVAAGSGSSFVYFIQPILVTVVTGGVFLLSLVVGRPLIERIAGDFWPITPEMAENPRVVSLFRGLTLLWAGVNFTTAAVSFVLLLWLPMATFVAVKGLSGLVVTISAITLTIVWSHRTACREGILTAPPPKVELLRAA
jgi:hypothetical protein